MLNRIVQLIVSSFRLQNKVNREAVQKEIARDRLVIELCSVFGTTYDNMIFSTKDFLVNRLDIIKQLGLRGYGFKESIEISKVIDHSTINCIGGVNIDINRPGNKK